MARAGLEKRIGPPGTPGPVLCRRDRVCGSDALAGFYRQRDFRPAWIDDRLGLGEDGRPPFREDIYLRDAAPVKAPEERDAAPSS
jgi:hypothetical protein